MTIWTVAKPPTPANYTTINDAVNAGTTIAGDIVEVIDSSTYNETVQGKADITVRAGVGQTPKIAGAPVTQLFSPFNNNHLEGFILERISGTTQIVVFNQPQGSSIRRCTFRTLGATKVVGVLFAGNCNGSRIERCRFEASLSVALDDQDALAGGTREFFNNVFLENDGIRCDKAGTTRILGNSIYRGRIVTTANVTGGVIENNAVVDKPGDAAGAFQIADATTKANTRNNVALFDADNPASTFASNGFDASNLSQNPAFFSPTTGDLRLREGSPAVDAGLSHAAFYTVDFAGTGRPLGAAYDAGAFEGFVNIVPDYGNASPPSAYTPLVTPPPAAPDTSAPSPSAGYLPLARTFTGNPSGTAVYTVGSLIGDPATSTSSPARSYTPLFVEPVGVPGRSFRLLDLMPRINVREDDL